MTRSNIAQVGNMIRKSKLIGLGESTHGTHEFFVNKTEIFKELVAKHGFNTIMLEDSQAIIERLNSILKTGGGDLKKLVRTLYPVWQTREILNLLEWMKENSSQYGLNIIGFDIDQSKIKPEHRDKYMAENIKNYIEKTPNAKSIVWAHNFHISKTRIGGYWTMGHYLNKWLGNDYYAIAQLFGKGEISATKIDECSPNSKDRTLNVIPIRSIAEDLLEKYLDTLSRELFIIETRKLKRGQARHKQKIRSIGWGLVSGMLDMYTYEIDIFRAYDAIIYCPKSSRSRSLRRDKLSRI